MLTKPMSDISHENPMYCDTSPPNNGPKKYARLTLCIGDVGKNCNNHPEKQSKIE